MCNNVSKIIFCTCGDETERLHNTYYWNLSRFAGLRLSSIKGIIMRPSEDLGNEVTTKKLLDILNQESPFDFDYTPAERDTLNVSVSTPEVRHKYFSLIFKNGKWEEGTNPSFVTQYQHIANGVIEVVKETSPE